MSNDTEARITRLEEDVRRLSELVGRFTISEVGGNVTVQVDGPVQGISITTDSIDGDLLLNTKDIQGMTVSTDSVGNDLSVSVQKAGGVTVTTDSVGNDVSVHAVGGEVTVNTADVGGEVG